MNNKHSSYLESHPLELNVYLLFYAYIFVILLVANVLPVLPATYFLFLFFGIAGLSILVIKFTYGIAIDQDNLALFIKIPFTITLLTLPLSDIKAIERTVIDDITYRNLLRRNGYKIYFMNSTGGVKLTMMDGRVFVISGIDVDRIIDRISLAKD